MKFTVSQLIELAKNAQLEIDAGLLSPDSEVNISLEVCDDNDEDTFTNRVFGGEPIEIGVTKRLMDESYVHIQLIGKPNFPIYPTKK